MQIVLFEQPDLIKACGYPSEVHNIATEDGYILETHRIANPGKQPVILMHGVLDSSMAWVMTGPKHSLGKACDVFGNSTRIHIVFGIAFLYFFRICFI